MRFYCFLFVLPILMFACEPDNKTSDLSETGLSSQDSTDTIIREQFNESNQYNQLSLFLAGKETKIFKGIQNKPYYKDYKNKLERAWNATTRKNLKEIGTWSEENVRLTNDSLPLFYPFSGPDFLYADAFYPKAKKYILIGLENPGKLPPVSKMNDKQIMSYLSKLFNSLRYINKAGYFTTKQMQSDFTDSSLNGIIHLLCFYLAKTDHKIAKITPVKIDHYGNEEDKKSFESLDEYVNGIKFYFFTSENVLKTLYYFPVDLSDQNLKNQFGLITFIGKEGEKNCFLKSASYVLHNKEFSIIRDIILKQSKTIIQDDTGIPYQVLGNSGFTLKLFGEYSRTINMFKNYYQPELREALKETKAERLPFKLGYNSWKNEMVLIIANENNQAANKPITYKIEKEGVIYKVQVKSSWKKIPLNDKMFYGLPKVDYYHSDNLYKYTIGSFSSLAECEDYINKAVKRGFKDAFVVAFYRKNRITLDEAERILNN